MIKSPPWEGGLGGSIRPESQNCLLIGMIVLNKKPPWEGGLGGSIRPESQNCLLIGIMVLRAFADIA